MARKAKQLKRQDNVILRHLKIPQLLGNGKLNLYEKLSSSFITTAMGGDGAIPLAMVVKAM